MSIELRNSDRLPPPVGYSHAAIGPAAGRVVHLAGQIGVTADGAHPDGLAAQVTQALRNFVDALLGVGGSLDDLAKMTVYVVGWDESKQSALLEGLAAVQEEHPIPTVPITLVGVSALYFDASLVEIEGVAVLPA